MIKYILRTVMKSMIILRGDKISHDMGAIWGIKRYGGVI